MVQMAFANGYGVENPCRFLEVLSRAPTPVTEAFNARANVAMLNVWRTGERDQRRHDIISTLDRLLTRWKEPALGGAELSQEDFEREWGEIACLIDDALSR
jgi:hypothetical protein